MLKQLLSKMMRWANVSAEQLKQAHTIHTVFGQTLSWAYWEYVLSHPITKWEAPTEILYGENDHFIERDVVERFAHKFCCNLTILENGEHWLHTEKQLAFMRQWFYQNLERKELQI